LPETQTRTHPKHERDRAQHFRRIRAETVGDIAANQFRSTNQQAITIHL
jgi:hypothetical protein